MLDCFHYYSEFNEIMSTKKSKKLTLILFYSEYSMSFLKGQSILKKIIEDLAPIGMYLFQIYKVVYNKKICCS